MTHADIPLPNAVRRLVDLLLTMVAEGLRSVTWRAGVDPGYALVLARRLARVLRCVFVILAVRLEVVERATAARKAPAGASRGACARMPCLPLTMPYRPFATDAPGLQPPQFAAARGDASQTVVRAIARVAYALAAPMAHVRRLARLMRRCVCYIPSRPQRRPPPTSRRHFLDLLHDARDQADFDLREWRRAHRDAG